MEQYFSIFDAWTTLNSNGIRTGTALAYLLSNQGSCFMLTKDDFAPFGRYHAYLYRKKIVTMN